jgi:RNA polymerase sigma factor (sigma-70 family)
VKTSTHYPPPKKQAFQAVTARIVSRERRRLLRFLRNRMARGNAERFLQENVCAALKEYARLFRGETSTGWLTRVMRGAVETHYRGRPLDEISSEPLWRDAQSSEAAQHAWAPAIGTCVRGLLPTLRPRYAELIQRLDLAGQEKRTVARDLKISVGTADVVLHRARRVLHRRMALVCAERHPVIESTAL